ncbi:MAG: DUF2007 domain-containing protein [Odoribacteraceae bacterium]|jgi:hypothetical protein|nr:DUF2007 domain-containing protein [Odoribacteraceae bacterium]
MEDPANNLVTVISSIYPHELVILQGRLESEGIYCFIRDELTAQLNPFVSDAIGGAKLQVRQEDFERAFQLLEEGGYVEEEDYRPSPLELRMFRLFSRIPFLRRIYK